MDAASNSDTAMDFANSDLNEHINDISPMDMAELRGAQEGIIKQDEKFRDDMNRFVKGDLFTKSIMKEAHIDFKRKPSQYADFMKL